MSSAFSNPVAENSVPAKATVWPYVLVRSSAVIVSGAVVTVSAPAACVMV